MRALLARFKADVGADPLQVLVLLASFAVAAYAFYRASFGPLPARMAVWFVASILAHDLVLYPVYAIADNSWSILSRKARARVRLREPRVPVVNFVRVPIVFSGLFLLVFWGLISGQGGASFQYASDHPFLDYLTRWLITVGVFFGVSALLYAVTLGRHLRRDQAADIAAQRPYPAQAAGPAGPAA